MDFQGKWKLTACIKIFEKHLIRFGHCIKHADKSVFPFMNDMDYTETQFKVMAKSTGRL